MSVAFVGSVSLSVAMPTLSADLEAAFTLLNGLGLAFQAQLVADVQAQLSAQLEAGIELGVTLPSASIGLMIQGALQAVADLQVSPPALTLEAQITANVQLVAELTARLELLLSLLAPVNAYLDAYLELRGLLLSGAIRMYRAEGPIESAIGEVDALANGGHPGSIPAGRFVKAVVFLADTSEAQASAALDVAFAAGP